MHIKSCFKAIILRYISKKMAEFALSEPDLRFGISTMVSASGIGGYGIAS
jgi:hypothetical protein